ncbi:hypothetical protein ACFVUS_07155 [Nocardia sp. NPDC058058]|uniref:hypothetical protein n=1 Tax=Nocardia sp. NPDC058058 TaxID=3346317 RepID=UPI0036D87CE5
MIRQDSPQLVYGPDRSAMNSSVKHVADCRDVYELIDHNIRPRPGMWARGESLQELMVLLSGYGVALELHSVPEEFALGPVGPFSRWLHTEFGWGMALGWASAIEHNLNDTETAMDAFFRLLDQYRTTLKPSD